MKNIGWFGLLLLLLGVGCAPRVAPPELAAPKPAPVESEWGHDKGDNECSYFYFLWGRTAEAEQRYDEALEAYEKAVVCDENDDYVMRHLVLLLLKMDKKLQAVEWLEKIIARHPRDMKVKAWLGNLYEAMDDRPTALRIYQEVLAVEPGNSEIQLRLSALYANALEYEKARTILEKLVASEPNSFLPHYYLAKLYRLLHFADKALAEYELAMSLKWSVSLALEAAELYELELKPASAVKIYLRILGDDAANEQAAGRLTRVYLQQKEVDKALAVLEELRHYAAEPREVDFSIGRILLEQHRLDPAIALFGQMLAEAEGEEREATAAASRYFLAIAYYEKNEEGKARKLLQEIPTTSDVYEDAMLFQARIIREKQDLATAGKFLQELLANPKTAKMGFYVALAGFYLEGKQGEAGEALFQKALDLFPGRVELLFDHALFLDKSGNTEAAVAEMEKVLALKPDDPFALNYVGYSWAEKRKNLAEAQNYIEKAVSLRPEDGFIRDSLGWLFYIKGEMALAVVELEKALRLEPDDPTINEHMGDAYLGVAEGEKALAAYRKSLELYKEEEKKAAVSRKIEKLENRGGSPPPANGARGCH